MGLCECMCVEAFDSLDRSIIELTTVCVYDTAVNLQCLKASRKPENKMLLSLLVIVTIVGVASAAKNFINNAHLSPFKKSWLYH